MAASPTRRRLQQALIGALLGIVAALGAQYLFVWRDLRWSWALLPAGAGLLVAAGARIVESWSSRSPSGGC